MSASRKHDVSAMMRSALSEADRNNRAYLQGRADHAKALADLRGAINLSPSMIMEAELKKRGEWEQYLRGWKDELQGWVTWK